MRDTAWFCGMTLYPNIYGVTPSPTTVTVLTGRGTVLESCTRGIPMVNPNRASLSNVVIQEEIHMPSWKLQLGANETRAWIEIYCLMSTFWRRLMSPGWNCILQQKKQAHGWRLTNKCEYSAGDSCPQLETRFCSKGGRCTDGDWLANVEIQQEIHFYNRKLHLGAKKAGVQTESDRQMWRSTVECGESGGDSCLQLETACWSKTHRHRGDSLSNVEIQVEIHVCSRQLHFGAKGTGTEMEIHCWMWRFRWKFMFAAENCILEQKRREQRWRFTVKYGDSGGDSCLQLETAFWSKKDRQRDGDWLSNVEIQVEIHVCSWKLHFGAKETGTVIEIHGQM